jgi:acetyltransferase-like isoleucine patch superfamily enzyme
MSGRGPRVLADQMRKYIKLWLNFAIIKINQLLMKPTKYWRFVVASCIEYGPNVTIGRHTYGITQETICLAPSQKPPSVEIGNFCSIAPGVLILANVDHPTNLVSTFPFRSLLYPRMNDENVSTPPNLDAVTRGSVEIGHDVWIGQNSIILSGVKIGTGAIIGAGSLVAKDIPPYAIAVGNPAKAIRFRFPPETIERLLNSEWWSLSDEKIVELEPFLYDVNVDNFISQVALMRSKTMTS